MIVNILGWGCLIASWTVPQKWFSNETKHQGVCLALSSCAFGLFIGAILASLGL